MHKSSIAQSIINHVITILLMALISILSLLVLSILTYLFKWQAPQAMIGIILTYILAGFGGGLLSKPSSDPDNNRQLQHIAIDSIVRGSGYMLLLALISLFIAEPTHINMPRLLAIWLLIVAGYAIGEILRGRIGKNR